MPCGQIDYHTAFYIRLSKIMLHNRNDRRASVSRLLNNYTHRAKTKEQFSLDASNCSQPNRSLPHLFYTLIGPPGPTGIPSRNHINVKAIHTIVRAIE